MHRSGHGRDAQASAWASPEPITADGNGDGLGSPHPSLLDPLLWLKQWQLQVVDKPRILFLRKNQYLHLVIAKIKIFTILKPIVWKPLKPCTELVPSAKSLFLAGFQPVETSTHLVGLRERKPAANSG